MVTIQIPDVPDDVHAELVRRAEVAGQPLDAFVLEQLREAVHMQVFDPEHNKRIFEECVARAKANPGAYPPPGWGAREIRRMRDAASGDL